MFFHVHVRRSFIAMKGCLSCKCWRGFHCNERESFITVLERVTRAGKKMCAEWFWDFSAMLNFCRKMSYNKIC